MLRLKALAVHKDHGQSGPDSSVTLVVLALRLAELLVVREADVTILLPVLGDITIALAPPHYWTFHGVA